MLAELRAHVIADSAVNAIITERMFADEAPQGSTYPALIYTSVSAVYGVTMRGEDDLVQERVQIDAYAKTKDGVEALADAVRDSLKGFRGTLQSTHVQLIKTENAGSGYEPETKLFRRRRDYLIWYTE